MSIFRGLPTQRSVFFVLVTLLLLSRSGTFAQPALDDHQNSSARYGDLSQYESKGGKRLTGCIRSEEGYFFLEDKRGKIVSLTGSDVSAHAGREVVLHGEWESSASASASSSGASGRTRRMFSVTSVDMLSDTCVSAKSKSAPPVYAEEVIAGEKREVTPSTTYSVVKVFYATDRKATGSNNPRQMYGSERNSRDRLSFGIAEVSIPRDHRMGRLEAPSMWRLYVSDPSLHVVLLDISRTPEDEFYTDLTTKVQSSLSKEALVFIHGYDNTFENAARRTAQIAYDLGFDGAPILYSWPSAGRAADYPADEAAVEWTHGLHRI